MKRTTEMLYFSGRVQGVGFRAATQRLARGSGVEGFVQNLPDGRVEVTKGVVRGRHLGNPTAAGSGRGGVFRVSHPPLVSPDNAGEFFAWSC